ncbi:MAG TPA: ABC transporter permease [Chloroflexia bacterium]|nr:ABC transporter permease [Chloroflexia bacterium]
MPLMQVTGFILTTLKKSFISFLNRPYPVSNVSFVRKELFGALRQPRLILSMVAGPFLILALFGLGYFGPGNYSTILVVPDDPGISTKVSDYKDVVKQTFHLVGVTKDLQEARQSLNQGDVQVVIVVPDNALEEIYNGKHAVFPVYYRSLSPVDSNYIEYSTYVYASEFDKVILRQAFASSKTQRSQLQESSRQIDASTDLLDHSMRNGDLIGAEVEVRTMKAVVQVTRRTLDSLILPGTGEDNTTQKKLLTGRLFNAVVTSGVDQMQSDLDNIDTQLNALQAGFDRGDLNSPEQRAHLKSIRQSNQSLGERANKVANIPPSVLVEPVLTDAENQVKTSVSYINFYGPAVVMLLIQHIAVTLAALSNVRDRQLGALEVFRVAPISPTQVLTGKFISFTLLLLALSLLLIGLITQLLGVPFLDFGGRWWRALAYILVTIYASIGLGFLIAGLSHTESQAVQFSMLLLLASIFFTGFILPLNQFAGYIRGISYILPITFGAAGLQNTMLDIQPIDLINLLAPFLLGTFYMAVGLLLYQRQYKLA